MSKYVFFLILLSSHFAFAQDSTTTGSINLDTVQFHYIRFTRLSILAGADGQVGAGKRQVQGFSGALLADFGNGAFSVETGAEFLDTPAMLSFANGDPNQTNSKVPVYSQYAAVPIFLKYNYFENPDTAFSFKAGVMRAFLVSNPAVGYANQNGTLASVTVPSADLLVAVGCTGTVPLSRTLSFVVDGTIFHGTENLDGNGAHNRGFLLNAGLSLGI